MRSGVSIGMERGRQRNVSRVNGDRDLEVDLLPPRVRSAPLHVQVPELVAVPGNPRSGCDAGTFDSTNGCNGTVLFSGASSE